MKLRISAMPIVHAATSDEALGTGAKEDENRGGIAALLGGAQIYRTLK
jgi:hypothetical protein